MKTALAFFLVIISLTTYAQDSESKAKLDVSGYIDFYYAHYTDHVEQGSFEKFTTVAPRNNGFSLDIAQLSMNYTADRIRAHVTVHYGDIPSSSWSSVFNFIQQGYIGYNVAKNVWIDAGLFTTHIGTEALLPKDNKLSTLALGTYHEPYYQSGFAVRYDPGEKVSVSLHLLNGYNNFLDNNRSKSAGVLVKYIASEKVTVSYSNLLGQETLGHDLRFYNNAVLALTPLKKTSLTLGADYGVQNGMVMSSGMAILNYAWTNNFSSTIRAEYFDDPNGFLSGLFPSNANSTISTGLSARGITLGFEYKPTDNSYVRIESRRLTSPNTLQFFTSDGVATGRRTEVIFTTGIWF